jgi:hypothetical protein
MSNIGKRSGKKIGTKHVPKDADGTDNMEAFFDAAQLDSPVTASVQTKTRVVKKKRDVRFSLQSAEAEEATTPTREAVAKYAKNMIRNTRMSMSPSNLSRAETEAEPKRDASDEQDDMVPPAPPESPEPVAEEEEEEEANFPVQDDDDDDDEGVGFELQESTTPASSKTASSKKKKRVIQQDEEVVDEAFPVEETSDEEVQGEEDSEDVPKKKRGRPKEHSSKKKLKKVSKKYGVIHQTSFFPKGIPQQREYTSVPVSDYKPDNASDHGLRRSKRAHIQPLEYWRGERIIYGPNDFDEDMYASLQNMPVPKEVSRAQPTPYKQRAKSAATKKKATEPAAPQTLDVAKLKNKRKYKKGTEAYLWDDDLDEPADLSTYSIWFESLAACISIFFCTSVSSLFL